MPKYSYYGFGIAIVRGYVIDGEVDHSIITAYLSFYVKLKVERFANHAWMMFFKKESQS